MKSVQFLLKKSIKSTLTILASLVLSFATQAANGVVDCAGTMVKPKTVTIYNNTNKPIYPVLQTAADSVDNWIKACLKSPQSFPHKKIHRIYINDLQGIQPNSSVTLSLPLFTKMVANPGGTAIDETVNWWKGGRVLVFDSTDELGKFYEEDRAIPGNPVQFPDDNLVTCTPDCTASVYESDTIYPETTASQLTEYTMGSPHVNDEKPGESYFEDHLIDYDISYVDHLFLPIAMGLEGNNYIGYVGTITDFDKFERDLKGFLENKDTGKGWPLYNISKGVKIPGAYNVFALNLKNDPHTGKKILGKQGESVKRMKNLWAACINYYSELRDKDFPVTCPPAMKADLETIDKFFSENYKKYQNAFETGVCKKDAHKVTKTPELMLTHIYGWVPFNQKNSGIQDPEKNAACLKADFNALYHGIDPKEYQRIELIYRGLQYSFKTKKYEGIKQLFNPYTKLIHDPELLDVNAYAFSIDDAVGNMNEEGTGLIITVGGAKGLKNTERFSFNDGFQVTFAPQHYPGLTYGACNVADGTADSCKPDREAFKNASSFRIGTSKYPVKVVFESKGVQYAFVVDDPAAGWDEKVLDKNKCSVNGVPNHPWCGTINVNYQPGSDNGKNFISLGGPATP